VILLKIDCNGWRDSTPKYFNGRKESESLTDFRHFQKLREFIYNQLETIN
jgi:hypothetical protein